MANHTKIIKLDGSLTIEQIKNTIQDINNDIFNGLLPVAYNDESNYISICKSLSDKSYDGLNMWVQQDYIFYSEDDELPVNGLYIDIRQGHASDFYWWLDYVIIVELANRLNAIVLGEGFDYKLERPENGYEYTKTFRETLFKPYFKTTWIDMLFNRVRAKWELDKTKEDISPELFDLVWKMKKLN
jgi:hypothetical protein